MAEAAGYDIIGDVHGHAAELEALLHKLDYRKQAGAWRHPDRTAVDGERTLAHDRFHYVVHGTTRAPDGKGGSDN